MPAKIIITNGITQRFNRTIQEWYNDFTPGYKRFKDVKIETKVGSQKIFQISMKSFSFEDILSSRMSFSLNSMIQFKEFGYSDSDLL